MNKKMVKQLFPDLSKDDFKKLVREDINNLYAEAKDVETIQYISLENIDKDKYNNIKYDPIGNPYIIIK